MKVCGTWEKEADMECLPSVVEIISKVIGSMISEKVKDHISFVKKIRYLLVNGSMMHLKLEFIHKLKTQLQSESKEKSILLTLMFYLPSIKSV